MNGGMFLRSISVAPITSSSAGVSSTLSFVRHAYCVSPSFAVPEIPKTKGQVVILASAAAQIRRPNTMSEYCTSKHAVLRFAEFIAIGECYCSISRPH